MANTAGFALVELVIVIAVIAVLATIAVPQFSNYRARSLVTQVVASSEAIRAALASYAAGSQGNVYPPSTAITGFDSLRFVVNAEGGMLPASAIFTVNHYSLDASHGETVAETYSMRLSVNGVASGIAGAQLLISPQEILKCTATGNPC